MTAPNDTPSIFDLKGKRVFVAGHRGMVGSAVVRRLGTEACTIVSAERSELDLTRQTATEQWMRSLRPEVVVVAAAKVGGIKANNERPAEFLADNLEIALNLIRASHSVGVTKLLFLGSTCIYPRLAQQPMSEDQLLTGPLEPTNQWYAVAKIAGIKLCQAYRSQYGCDYISAMPTNLYGPEDTYHPEHSHVAAALLRRFHEAKVGGNSSATVWGTGTARRELMHVDDMADACVFLLKHYSAGDIVNIGWGRDIAISDLAQMIAAIVGYTGKIVFDPTKPDGTPRKLVDTRKLTALGWLPCIDLRAGLSKTYEDFKLRQELYIA